MIINEKILKKVEKLKMKVRNISVTHRQDFESENPQYDSLTYITYYIEVNNINLLGERGDVFTEVYPRLKQLKKDLLQNIEIEDNCRIEFVYLTNSDKSLCIKGENYNKAEVSSFGDVVIGIEELSQKNNYYKILSEKYRIYYGVKTNNGTVIGPDAGLIIGSNFIAKYYEGNNGIDILEIGAGACSTPISMFDRYKIKSYHGIDFSKKMRDNYNRTIKNLFDERGINSTFVVSDAFSCAFPEKTDIFVLGIYYEAQLDFIAKRYKDILKTLNNEGMLIIQTGLPENRMFNDLLMVNDEVNWPWYNKKSNLRNYFSCVCQVNLNDEIVIIASNNKSKIKMVIEDLSKEFIIEQVFLNENIDTTLY